MSLIICTISLSIPEAISFFLIKFMYIMKFNKIIQPEVAVHWSHLKYQISDCFTSKDFSLWKWRFLCWKYLHFSLTKKITTFYKLSASDILDLSFAAMHICCYQNDLTRQALFMEDLLQKKRDSCLRVIMCCNFYFVLCSFTSFGEVDLEKEWEGDGKKGKEC